MPAKRISRPWLVFTLVAVAQFMVVLDISITNVALPSIKNDLHFMSDSTLQWVITAYALTFGGFLLLGGRAADLFGRRRTLLIGMSCFTLISFLIGFSQSAIMLITLRALQGIAAALMSPSALSIVLATFKEGPERGRALGFWSTIATGGAAIGLLLGGALTQFLSWQWNFFINVPVGITVVFAVLRLVPAYESSEVNTRLDLSGALLSTSGIMAFVFALSEAPRFGWLSPLTLGIFALALVFLGLFVRNESRSAHPLMPLSIFRIGNVVGANLIMVFVYACVLGLFFILTLYLQSVLHYSPVLTGLAFLPFPLTLGLVSANVPRWVQRFGYRRFLLIGPTLIALALAWLTRLPVNGSYFIDLLPAFIVFPIGVGMSFMPIVTAATSGVSQSESGLASGLINTSQQMGGALGLAVLSGIASGGNASESLQTLVTHFDLAFLSALVFIVFAFLIALLVIRENRERRSSSEFQMA